MKILFIKANPLDTADLRLEKEENVIRDALQKSPNTKSFSFEVRGAVTKSSLLDYLFEIQPDILHISGHGGEGDRLFFEDNEGYTEEVSISKFSDVLTNFLDHLNCVVLNACHSLADIDSLNNQIPYIIGMKEEIPNDSAVEFSSTFYTSIFNGRTIPDSFRISLGLISLGNLEDSQIPILLDNSIGIGDQENIAIMPDDNNPNGDNNGLTDKLVSDEEIELAKKQKRKKIKLHYISLGAFFALALGVTIYLITVNESDLLNTVMAMVFPTIFSPITYNGVKKSQKIIDILDMFALKRKRYMRGIANLSTNDIEDLNDEFTQIIIK